MAVAQNISTSMAQKTAMRCCNLTETFFGPKFLWGQALGPTIDSHRVHIALGPTIDSHIVHIGISRLGRDFSNSPRAGIVLTGPDADDAGVSPRVSTS